MSTSTGHSIIPLTHSLLKIDKLTCCWNDSNKDHVKGTISQLIGMKEDKLYPNFALAMEKWHYKASAQFVFPSISKSEKTTKILFQVAPYMPSASAYRLSFNPSKLSAASLSEFLFILDHLTDTTAKLFLF